MSKKVYLPLAGFVLTASLSFCAFSHEATHEKYHGNDKKHLMELNSKISEALADNYKHLIEEKGNHHRHHHFLDNWHNIVFEAKTDLNKHQMEEIEHSESREVHITNVDEKHHSFKATVITDDHHEMKIHGKFQEMMRVPVAAKAIPAGHVVEDTNLHLRTFPVAQVREDTALDNSDVTNKTAHSHIMAGKPISKKALGEALLIERNKPVTILYEKNGIEIKVNGVAMESGVHGQMVKVKNSQSHKVVHGVVEDHAIVKFHE